MRRSVTSVAIILLWPSLLKAQKKETGNLYLFENKGQIVDQHQQPRNDIRFRFSSGGVNVFAGNGSLHYQFNERMHTGKTETGKLPTEEPALFKTYRMDVTLVGSNPRATVVTGEQQPYVEHYYLTNGSEVTAHTYKKVTYKDVYPNIDWVLKLNADGKLEYDFVVRPGGNISDIRLKYDGATALKLGNNGTITAATPMGTITEQAPVSFTEADGRPVASSFVLKGNELSFRTAPHKGTLVIDPTIDWATYYGGSLEDDNGEGRFEGASDIVATDAACNVYLGGRTNSANNIATTGTHQGSIIGILNGFVVKFNNTGVRQWATYYPGAYSGPFIAADKWGNVYLAGGAMLGGGIATPSSHQPANAGGYDAFLVKFNTNGLRIWGTYYGGAQRDIAYSVRCDAAGNVVLAGYTEGSTAGIASTGSHQDAFGGGVNDAFVVKFDSAGVRQWGTYYGGSDEERAHSVSFDASGNVYLTGYTLSTSGIASAGSHQASYTNGGDAFLVKFNSAGVRQWGTYYGGNGLDRGQGASTDAAGNVYLGGWTESTAGIATTGTHQPAHGGGTYDAFIAKFNSAGVRQWGTYYGGNDMDQAYAMKADPQGNVYLGGYTYSNNNIATTGSYQETHAGVPFNFDGFLAKFDATGSRQYGTYFGGPESDYVYSLHTDASGAIYIAGYTDGSTTGIATTGAHQTTYGGGTNDNFVARFTDCDQVFTKIIAGTPKKFCQGDSVMLRTSVNSPVACVSYQWKKDGADIGGATDTAYAAKSSGIYTVTLNANGCSFTSDPDTVEVYPLPVPVITANGVQLGTDSFLNYQWYLNGTAIGGATGRKHTALQNGSYTVRVIDSNGCSNTSAAYNMTVVSVHEIGNLKQATRVYPNPFNTLVYIDAPAAVNVTVLNLLGQVLVQKDKTKEIDLGQLPSGTYLMSISTADGALIKTEKLFKAETGR